jgi:hypothetical protein
MSQGAGANVQGLALCAWPHATTYDRVKGAAPGNWGLALNFIYKVGFGLTKLVFVN